MKTIADVYGSFAEQVVPKDAPPVQRQETRRAFYAGAAALYEVLSSIPDNLVESGAAAVEKELQDFAKAVSADRA